jgi:protein-disulfide isomerase
MNEAAFTLKTPPGHADHRRGPLNASVIIVEYGDYQCPFCAATAPVLDKLFRRYDDLCLVFRHFPMISNHPNAGVAAVAAEAANRQGKFWEMHQALFENQQDLSTENIFVLAKNLGLDMRDFLNDLEDERLLERVRKDINSGVLNGVNATPTIFVNGIRFEGMPSLDELQNEVDQIISDNANYL